MKLSCDKFASKTCVSFEFKIFREHIQKSRKKMVCLDPLSTCLKTTTIKSRENLLYLVYWKTQFILAISPWGFIFFNSKDFSIYSYLYAWSWSLCGGSSFCMGLIPRKLWGLSLMFLTRFTLLDVFFSID